MLIHDHLSQDMLLEILYRLPIATLMICMAVCKAWKSLIKNPTFISGHLNRTITSNNLANTNRLLLRLCTLEYLDSGMRALEHYLVCIDNEDSYMYGIDSPFNQRCLREPFHPVGSCNGLVCLAYMAYYIHTYILWNPTLRKAFVIPKPSVTSFFNCFLGFGFDPETNDYKLLRFVQNCGSLVYDPENSFEVDLFSLKSNSWKSFPAIASKYSIPTRYRPNYGHSFVNGCIHFLATDNNVPRGKLRNLVLMFNVNKEAFHEIPLPECLIDQPLEEHTNLLKYGESIAVTYLTFYKQRRAWVMKEYGVATSWTEISSSILKRISTVVAFRNNIDEALMEVYPRAIGQRVGRLVSHDLKTQETTDFTDNEGLVFEQSFADSFVESLVLLDIGEDANPAMWDRITDERSREQRPYKSVKPNDAGIVAVSGQKPKSKVGRLLNYEGFGKVISKYWNAYWAKRKGPE